MRLTESIPFRRYRREPAGPHLPSSEGVRGDKRVLAYLQPAHLAMLR